MSSWVDTLDLYERSLEHHRALVETEVSDGPNPWPPSSLPSAPLPAELRERAAALLDESHLLIDDMAGKMADLPTLKPSRHPHHSTPTGSRWTTTL